MQWTAPPQPLKIRPVKCLCLGACRIVKREVEYTFHSFSLHHLHFSSFGTAFMKSHPFVKLKMQGCFLCWNHFIWITRSLEMVNWSFPSNKHTRFAEPLLFNFGFPKLRWHLWTFHVMIPLSQKSSIYSLNLAQCNAKVCLKLSWSLSHVYAY